MTDPKPDLERAGPGTEIQFNVCDNGESLTTFCPFCSAQLFGGDPDELLEDASAHLNVLHPLGQ